jgi:1,4-alpha-glucan branching enzyme
MKKLVKTKKPVKTVKAVKTKSGGKSTMASKRVKFEIQAEAGSEVYVAGTFNSWNAKQNRLKEKSGVFGATLLLPKGKHEYKFVINGVWCVDPKCQEWVPNNYGSLNSVVTVD